MSSKSVVFVQICLSLITSELCRYTYHLDLCTNIFTYISDKSICAKQTIWCAQWRISCAPFFVSIVPLSASRSSFLQKERRSCDWDTELLPCQQENYFIFIWCSFLKKRLPKKRKDIKGVEWNQFHFVNYNGSRSIKVSIKSSSQFDTDIYYLFIIIIQYYITDVYLFYLATNYYN